MISRSAIWRYGIAALLAGCAGSRTTEDTRGDWEPPPDIVLVGDSAAERAPWDLPPQDSQPMSDGAPLCPNGTCDKAAGESCGTCEKDCPCASDQYCDKPAGTCKACVPHKSSGCTADEQCCQAADICKNDTCCRPLGSPCTGPNDCCNANASCSAAGNCCMPVGTSCWDPKDCCGGHVCTNGQCV